jgi:hypothetical protein
VSPFGNGSEQACALTSRAASDSQSLGDLRFCMATTPGGSFGAELDAEQIKDGKLFGGSLMKSLFGRPNREGLTVSRVTE